MGILEHMNQINEKRLSESEVQLERGVIMHQFTGIFWAWLKRHHSTHDEVQEKFGQWVDLCDNFPDMKPEEIRQAFEALNLPSAMSGGILEPGQSHSSQPAASATGQLPPGKWE